MEKYRRHADAATGIQPFLPPHIPHRHENILFRIGKGLFRFAVGVVHFTFAITFLLVLAIITPLLHVAVPISSLRHSLFSLLHAILCRAILMSLGFYSIEFKQISQRFGTKTPPANVLGDMTVRRGDLIFCNHSSYVDVLYLAARYSPIFVVPYATGKGKDEAPGTVTVQKYGFFGMLGAVFSKRVTDTKKSSESLTAVMSAAQCPVVVFGEGCTTNNRTLLEFLPIFGDLAAVSGDGHDPEKKRVHIHSLKYEDATRTTYTVGHWIPHMFVMGGNISNTLTVKTVIREDVPKLKGSSDEDVSAFILAIRTLLAEKLLKVQLASITATSKRAFLEHYNETQGSAYTNKRD